MNKILIHPDPLLRKKSQLINKVGYEEKRLSKNMFEIMKESIGIGLAAPQIGELKRIITTQNLKINGLNFLTFSWQKIQNKQSLPLKSRNDE